jgi:hypothetical protein
MTRAKQRLVVVLVLAAIAGGCDLTTKGGEVAAISDLHIPSPSVVLGQLMRDSLGVETPLTLEVYDPNGQLLPTHPVAFTWFAQSIEIDQFGFVRGIIRDTIGVPVVGSAGNIQTPQHRIFVSVPPQIATMGTGPTAISFDSNVDTTAQSNRSQGLDLTITDNQNVAAQGFIVTYTITRSPTPLTAGQVTAFIANDAAKSMPRDTTDHAGLASRKVVLRQAAIGDAALLGGTKTDTIIVHVTASYGGSAIPGTPVDFIVPVAAKKP